jgi:hypothetical protein
MEFPREASSRSREKSRSALKRTAEFRGLNLELPGTRAMGIDNLTRLDREAPRGHSILMLMQWLPPMSPWPRS